MPMTLVAAEIDLDGRTARRLHIVDEETRDRTTIELPQDVGNQLAGLLCGLIAMAESPDHDEKLRCVM